MKRFYFDFFDDENLPFPVSHKDLDLRVSELLEHMPLTYAGRLMSGLKRFVPQLRWRLPRAKQYFSNWQSIHVTGQAARFPPAVIMAYAGLAVATKQYSLAALLLVGYLAFLRTGEIVSLTASKVAVHAA
jgi:hypothetical protein